MSRRSTIPKALRPGSQGVKKSRRLAILSCVLAICLMSGGFLSFRYFNKPLYSLDTIAKVSVTVTFADFKDEEVSDSVLLEAIRASDIKFEYHVLAQAIVESHNYNSKIYMQTNNLFGMRYPGKRSTTASGIYLSKSRKVVKGKKHDVKKYLRQFNFCVYDHWYDAVRDYKLWQESVYKSDEDYSTFLKRVYATAPEYNIVIEKLAALLKEKYEVVEVAVPDSCKKN